MSRTFIICAILLQLTLFVSAARDTKTLDKYKIKYSKSGLLWTISDAAAGLNFVVNKELPTNAPLRRSRTLFLEEGTSSAGLQHLYQRHGADFKAQLGVTGKTGISNEIERIMDIGRYAAYGYQARVSRGRKELAVLYQINESKYLHVAIGDNGFIVTAYPVPKADVNLRDYQY